jgi:hypothetical protein
MTTPHTDPTYTSSCATPDDTNDTDEVNEVEDIKQFLAAMHNVSIEDISAVTASHGNDTPASDAVVEATATGVVVVTDDVPIPLGSSGLPLPEWVRKHFRTTSAMIRFYGQYTQNCSVIAELLGIKYQHARNVLKTPLKRGVNESYTITPSKGRVE